MKPRPKPKPRPEFFIYFLLFTIVHFSCGLCRDIRNYHLSPSLSEDLKIMEEQQKQKISPESFLIGRKDSLGDADYASEAPRPDSDHGVTDYDEYLDTRDDSVLQSSDVVAEVAVTSPGAGYTQTEESPAMDESQVWSLIDEVVAKRNRIRRQSPPSDSPPQWRRKHKRRHRLLLKSRKHSNSSQEGGRKGRKQHRSSILKSDSEAHIITSASEVKKDWCRTIPFTHKVTAPRCKPKVINNNFCYGQCNSFFIPQQRTSEGVAFQSYSNCKPDRLRWSNVTLDCPDLIPPVVQKTVLIVDSCRCIAMDEPNDERLNKNIRHHTRHFKGRSKKRT
ncbi:DAN domain family member 5 [Parasteatoda tepidariorum]|nr:DAN domain family member 5 [Parasteatoda tepidariorum]XP_015928457.1 DAN domain family member 5 [Parasteatoda tepidariorum]XP_015928464.1 DAN domain family member 5 [Parasteatoda tepidariorum]